MTTGPANNYFTNSAIKFGKWKMINQSTGAVYFSDTTTIYPYEQLFLDLGLALTIFQSPNPGDTIIGGSVTSTNGLIWAPPAVYRTPQTSG